VFVHTNLIYLRKKNSKTQAEIGAMLGMSLTAYGDYERESSKPSIEILAILSEYYDCTASFVSVIFLFVI
jgi:transcriptional regulator with XRE-family HTH domain